MAPRIPLVVKNTMLNQERATREREKGGNPRKGKSSDSNIPAPKWSPGPFTRYLDQLLYLR